MRRMLATVLVSGAMAGIAIAVADERDDGPGPFPSRTADDIRAGSAPGT